MFILSFNGLLRCRADTQRSCAGTQNFPDPPAKWGKTLSLVRLAVWWSHPVSIFDKCVQSGKHLKSISPLPPSINRHRWRPVVIERSSSRPASHQSLACAEHGRISIQCGCRTRLPARMATFRVLLEQQAQSTLVPPSRPSAGSKVYLVAIVWS